MVNSLAAAALENLDELQKACGVVEAALQRAVYLEDGSAGVGAAGGPGGALSRALAAERRAREAAERQAEEAVQRADAAMAQLGANASVFKLHASELRELQKQLEERQRENARLREELRLTKGGAASEAAAVQDVHESLL